VAKEAALKAVEANRVTAEKQARWKRLDERLTLACKDDQEEKTRERRDREIGVLLTLAREVLAEHRAEVAAQNAVDLERYHEIKDSQRVAEEHQEREHIRRLLQKFGR
jgi:hypothetical protein